MITFIQIKALPCQHPPNVLAMNCAIRLVEIFGSQAEVARAFRLDRAVVNNWVKSGYVPAR